MVIVIQTRLLGKRSYATVTGKSYRRRPTDLGPLKWVVFGILVLLFCINLAVPLFILVVGSFQQTTIDIRMNSFTLSHWEILGDPTVWRSLVNTLSVGVVASTVAMLAVTLSSSIIARTRLPLRRPLDVFTWVPYMVPSFV